MVGVNRQNILVARSDCHDIFQVYLMVQIRVEIIIRLKAALGVVANNRPSVARAVIQKPL